jgi:hypothetical protein
LRILGQLAEADSNDAEAEKFLSAAGRLSLHENYANYWLMRNTVTDHDYKSAIYYADVLLRTNPQSIAYVVPVMAQISEDKAGAPLVKAVLADNPPWRKQLFSALPQNVTDPRMPLDLLLALRNSPVPPTNEDLGSYINLLVARKFYGLAYYTWLQFLPSEQLASKLRPRACRLIGRSHPGQVLPSISFLDPTAVANMRCWSIFNMDESTITVSRSW